MGLYMNKSTHPDVFMNRGRLEEPNQDHFKTDYVAEMVEAQNRMNDSLTSACRNLQMLYQKQQQTQAKEWQKVENELDQLKASSQQHAQFEQHVMEGFHMLEEKNEDLYQRLEEEGLLKQEIKDEMKHIRETSRTVLDQVGEHEVLSQELTTKMDDLIQLQQTMIEAMSKHKEDQDKTLQSLENQDALMEKALRQLTNLRSVLFERTGFLAEKMENSYKLTSSFIYNVVSESDQPLAFRLDQKIAEEEQRKS